MKRHEGPEHRRYRSPSRWLSVLLMTVAGVGLVLVSGMWYTAARQEQLMAEDVPFSMEGAQPLPLTEADIEAYQVESIARTLDGNGQASGYLLIARANGYKSKIRVQAVFAPNKQTVVSVRVLYQQETEYLGTRITGEGFLSQFAGRQAPMRLWITPGKGSPVDAISGSTISSQAVVDAVNSAYRYLKDHPEL